MCACRPARTARCEQHLGGLQPRLIIVRSDPQPPNLGRPAQRPHARRAECRDCRQLRNLHDRERRLDALGDDDCSPIISTGVSQTPP